MARATLGGFSNSNIFARRRADGRGGSVKGLMNGERFKFNGFVMQEKVNVAIE